MHADAVTKRAALAWLEKDHGDARRLAEFIERLRAKVSQENTETV